MSNLLNEEEALRIINVFLTRANNNYANFENNGLRIVEEDNYVPLGFEGDPEFTKSNRVNYIEPLIFRHMKEPAYIPAYEYENGRQIIYPSFFNIKSPENMLSLMMQEFVWNCSFTVQEEEGIILLELYLYCIPHGEIFDNKIKISQMQFEYTAENKTWKEVKKEKTESRSFIIFNDDTPF